MAACREAVWPPIFDSSQLSSRSFIYRLFMIIIRSNLIVHVCLYQHRTYNGAAQCHAYHCKIRITWNTTESPCFTHLLHHLQVGLNVAIEAVHAVYPVTGSSAYDYSEEPVPTVEDGENDPKWVVPLNWRASSKAMAQSLTGKLGSERLAQGRSGSYRVECSIMGVHNTVLIRKSNTY